MPVSRRWTITFVEPIDTYTGGDGNATVEGPPVDAPVEVVPAAEVERLREKNDRLREEAATAQEWATRCEHNRIEVERLLAQLDEARDAARGYRDAYNAVAPLASGASDPLPWENDRSGVAGA